MPDREITLSVVSHGQNALVNQLLGDVQRHCASKVALVLTRNIPDPVPFATAGLDCPLEIVDNERAAGFGANHNAAFGRCRTRYFCVCNPDIRLPGDPFPALLAALGDPRSAVAGPLVRSPAGGIEDSARRYPTVGSLVGKLLGERRSPDYPVDRGAQPVDWLAGMFLVFKSDAFRSAGGFDPAYFLYYEDVDLCHRLRASGRSVLFEPRAEVVHDARRASRRNPRLALHHVASGLRFLWRRRA